jgi:hypothetical protein
MQGKKEQIMPAALRLFSRDGYGGGIGSGNRVATRAYQRCGGDRNERIFLVLLLSAMP